MKHEAAFLQAILEAPEDDAPRLVFADWLDDHGGAAEQARAEFIRAQIELARLDEDDPWRDALEPRTRRLLDEHGDAWRAEVPSWARTGCVFRRGFVDEVHARAAQFVKGAKALFQAAPVRHARLSYPVGAGQPPVTALTACPYLARLLSLALGNYPVRGAPIGDDGVRALVGSPHLAGLQALDLSGNALTVEGARAIAESPHLASLHSLTLAGNPHNPAYNQIGSAGAIALAGSAHLAALAELVLSGNRLDSAAVAALAASPHRKRLTRLDLNENPIDTAGAQALAAAPRLAGLTHLGVGHTRIGAEGVRALFTSRHLRGLDSVDLSDCGADRDTLRGIFRGPRGTGLQRLVLDHSSLEDDGFEILAPLRLRSLRAWGNGIGPAGAALLAGMPLLEGLRDLDLEMNELADEGVRALAASPRAAKLRVLNLAINEVGSAGAEALAASPHLAGLRVLRLFFNRIGNTGARALAASPYLKLLGRLYVGSNPIHKGFKDELKKRFGSALDLSSGAGG
jgi:uncharacterized protein (TIGR02996 family)